MGPAAAGGLLASEEVQVDFSVERAAGEAAPGGQESHPRLADGCAKRSAIVQGVVSGGRNDRGHVGVVHRGRVPKSRHQHGGGDPDLGLATVWAAATLQEGSRPATISEPVIHRFR
jgi:hypothetical protein